jgi:ABC-2 type transport system permease protein
MLSLIYAELIKITSRPRSYIGFAAITIIVSIIHFAMKEDGLSYLGFITQNFEQSFLMEGKILNGNLVCFIILQTLILQIPLLVALVTGDMVSGEAAAGTLRLLLTRPVSRTKVLFSKFIAGNIYIFLLLAWLGILALGAGLLIFGNGDLIVLKSDELVILQQDDVFWRFMAALAVAFIALVLIGSFSLLLSCFSDNSIGPIISTMAVVILFTIIGTMDMPVFDKIKPFLFTTHMIVWKSFFDNPLPVAQIVQSIAVMLLHIAGFTGLAIYHFNRKDILT